MVVGAGRSGTSAATRLVNLLGVPLCVPDDLMQPHEINPTGFWESVSLVEFNDRILAAAGTDYFIADELEPQWELSASLAALRDEAEAVFRAAHPTRTWVWKDPRTCLTLPFWRQVLSERLVCVFVHRRPVPAAASTKRFDPEHTVEYGLALWERLNASALESMSSLPVYAASFEALCDDAVGWSAGVAAFLDDQDVRVTAPDEAAISAFVDPALRHDHAHLEADRLTESQRRLADVLDSLDGPHSVFTTPSLMPPSRESDVVRVARGGYFARRTALLKQVLAQQAPGPP